MALSLSNLVRRKSDKPPRIVIYGVPGIGKTSLAAEFPDPIFIQNTLARPRNVMTNCFAATPNVCLCHGTDRSSPHFPPQSALRRGYL